MIGEPIDQLHYKAALRVIDGHRKLLHDAKSDPEIVRAYDAIVRHLYKLPAGQLDRLLGRRSLASGSQMELEKRSAEMADLPLQEIEEAVHNETTTRMALEAIAIGRFKMPRGSMRSVGSIDQLRSLISSFVDNERAHQSITEVARDAR